MIKCIVCDLDGTLIKNDDTIEERTYQSLKEYMDNGIEFLVATGRDINMVIDFLDLYHLDCDLLLNNGTQFCNRSQTINEIYPIDNDSFIKIAHILDDYGYLLAIHTDSGKFSLHDTEDFWDYHMKILHASRPADAPLPEKTFTTRKGYLRDFHYAKTPEEIIEKGIQVLKIDARHLDTYSVKGVKEQLNIDHLNYSSSFEDNIEITTDASDKGALLKKIIAKKGYQRDEVAVFGDGENDCQMLENFPYSFAPANASEHAKKVAHYQLTLTNEEGAVYEGLEILKNLKLL